MRGDDEMLGWAPPVTPQEDEAFEELAVRLADRIAARLADAPDDRPLLSVAQVAERLSISDRAARDLLYGRDGRPAKLPSVVVGDRSRRVVPADLDRYVEEARGGGADGDGR